jgi:hypothetical protein
MPTLNLFIVKDDPIIVEDMKHEKKISSWVAMPESRMTTGRELHNTIAAMMKSIA